MLKLNFDKGSCEQYESILHDTFLNQLPCSKKARLIVEESNGINTIEKHIHFKSNGDCWPVTKGIWLSKEEKSGTITYYFGKLENNSIKKFGVTNIVPKIKLILNLNDMEHSQLQFARDILYEKIYWVCKVNIKELSEEEKKEFNKTFKLYTIDEEHTKKEVYYINFGKIDSTNPKLKIYKLIGFFNFEISELDPIIKIKGIKNKKIEDNLKINTYKPTISDFVSEETSKLLSEKFKPKLEKIFPHDYDDIELIDGFLEKMEEKNQIRNKENDSIEEKIQESEVDETLRLNNNMESNNVVESAEIAETDETIKDTSNNLPITIEPKEETFEENTENDLNIYKSKDEENLVTLQFIQNELYESTEKDFNEYQRIIFPKKLDNVELRVKDGDEVISYDKTIYFVTNEPHIDWPLQLTNIWFSKFEGFYKPEFHFGYGNNVNIKKYHTGDLFVDSELSLTLNPKNAIDGHILFAEDILTERVHAILKVDLSKLSQRELFVFNEKFELNYISYEENKNKRYYLDLGFIGGKEVSRKIRSIIVNTENITNTQDHFIEFLSMAEGVETEYAFKKYDTEVESQNTPICLENGYLTPEKTIIPSSEDTTKLKEQILREVEERRIKKEKEQLFNSEIGKQLQEYIKNYQLGENPLKKVSSILFLKMDKLNLKELIFYDKLYNEHDSIDENYLNNYLNSFNEFNSIDLKEGVPKSNFPYYINNLRHSQSEKIGYLDLIGIFLEALNGRDIKIEDFGSTEYLVYQIKKFEDNQANISKKDKKDEKDKLGNKKEKTNTEMDTSNVKDEKKELDNEEDLTGSDESKSEEKTEPEENLVETETSDELKTEEENLVETETNTEDLLDEVNEDEETLTETKLDETESKEPATKEETENKIIEFNEDGKLTINSEVFNLDLDQVKKLHSAYSDNVYTLENISTEYKLPETTINEIFLMLEEGKFGKEESSEDLENIPEIQNENSGNERSEEIKINNEELDRQIEKIIKENNDTIINLEDLNNSNVNKNELINHSIIKLLLIKDKINKKEPIEENIANIDETTLEDEIDDLDHFDEEKSFKIDENIENTINRREELNKSIGGMQKTQYLMYTFITSIRNGSSLENTCNKLKINMDTINEWSKKGEEGDENYLKFYTEYKKLKNKDPNQIKREIQVKKNLLKHRTAELEYILDHENINATNLTDAEKSDKIIKHLPIKDIKSYLERLGSIAEKSEKIVLILNHLNRTNLLSIVDEYFNFEVFDESNGEIIGKIRNKLDFDDVENFLDYLTQNYEIKINDAETVKIDYENTKLGDKDLMKLNNVKEILLNVLDYFEAEIIFNKSDLEALEFSEFESRHIVGVLDDYNLINIFENDNYSLKSKEELDKFLDYCYNVNTNNIELISFDKENNKINIIIKGKTSKSLLDILKYFENLKHDIVQANAKKQENNKTDIYIELITEKEEYDEIKHIVQKID